MGKSPRCLFDCKIDSFLEKEKESVFGVLCERYHGDALTTTRDAWLKEIEILQKVLMPWKESNGQIILEYDIPRLGKRIDTVLLLKGIQKRPHFRRCAGLYLFRNGRLLAG